MTQLLEQAYQRLVTLPEADQDAVAALILEELEDETRWREAYDRSAEALMRLSEDARAENQAERTKMLEPGSATAAYEEIVDFIAGGCTPEALASFHPSEATRKHVFDLLSREKSESLTSEESAELSHYIELEHIMRLVKARAHQMINGK